jgi:hypothetical protein
MTRIKSTLPSEVTFRQLRQWDWKPQPLWHYLLLLRGRRQWKALCWMLCICLTLQEGKIEGWGRFGVTLTLVRVVKTALELHLFCPDGPPTSIHIFAWTFVRGFRSSFSSLFGNHCLYHVDEGLIWYVVSMILLSIGVPRSTVEHYTYRFILALIEPRTILVHSTPGPKQLLMRISWVFLLLDVVYKGIRGWARAVDAC